MDAGFFKRIQAYIFVCAGYQDKVNTILTANKFIKSFVPMTRIDTYGDSPEEMYLYITLIANYGINMGLGDDLSYDNYGYVIDNYGKKKAFVLDHELAFNRLGESYYGLSNILYPIDHKSAIIEDKMWKDTISKKEPSLINRFTKHCSKIFHNCKSAEITSAIKKMHSEVLSREVELHAFFDMKSVKDIIQKDEDSSYPRIHYHSSESNFYIAQAENYLKKIKFPPIPSYFQRDKLRGLNSAFKKHV